MFIFYFMHPEYHHFLYSYCVSLFLTLFYCKSSFIYFYFFPSCWWHFYFTRIIFHGRNLSLKKTLFLFTFLNFISTFIFLFLSHLPFLSLSLSLSLSVCPLYWGILQIYSIEIGISKSRHIIMRENGITAPHVHLCSV